MPATRGPPQQPGQSILLSRRNAGMFSSMEDLVAPLPSRSAEDGSGMSSRTLSYGRYFGARWHLLTLMKSGLE